MDISSLTWQEAEELIQKLENHQWLSAEKIWDTDPELAALKKDIENHMKEKGTYPECYNHSSISRCSSKLNEEV